MPYSTDILFLSFMDANALPVVATTTTLLLEALLSKCAALDQCALFCLSVAYSRGCVRLVVTGYSLV